MTLFEECMVALGNQGEVVNASEGKIIFKELTKLFPMTSWGRIDLEKTTCKMEKVNQADVLTQLSKCNKNIDIQVYIFWDEITLPAVKANLKKILEVIDDVTAVSFDTWIFCPGENYVIEFFHGRELTMGIFK
ncbi:hypothetical protein SPSIL_002670 [Sporomusa silvacetica DSM 10669]|uniref:Uncharacterized protein n=1 Tax=Sporomusa silvacetica DSM 10669 TaxID=1123289 RepID=A0ABZ3IER6_9FIRM|nr:hypothetical protein [Sporomusa silvacetica]OZC17831.1 hypothetical protein SPSIL_29710 [Sporomusa silvacetica DSM 10669]